MFFKKSLLSENIFKQPELKSCREGHAEALLELGKKDPRVVALTADVSPSTYYGSFGAAFPERFIECGVAEQNMLGVAAGLALSGKIPFVSGYAVFSPGRNWDQLRVSVCYTKANVKLVGSHAGINVGPDGATHQALEDLAITRVLPSLTVLAPCDYFQSYQATLAMAEYVGPVYMRFGREKTSVITMPEAPFKIGESAVLWPGKQVSIIAIGPSVYDALLAARMLKDRHNISAEVIDGRTLKPLDKKTLLDSVKKTRAVVSVEDHQQIGGLGGAMAELLAKEYPAPMEFVGVDDSFGESGSSQELFKKYHLTAADIVKAAVRAVKRK